MPETTVGLSDNNLFGSLIATTRSSASNQGAQMQSINPEQSNTEVEDEENNIDNIPFQEILGQHILNSDMQDAPNPQATNTQVVESANDGLTQESATETTPSLLYSHIQNTTETASALQMMFAQRPGVNLQGFSSNPPSNSGKTAGNTDLTIYAPAANVPHGNLPISPFALPSQRGRGWGFGETKGFSELPENQPVETSSPVSLFNTGKLFPRDMNIVHTPEKADAFTLNPLNNPENPQMISDSLIDDMQQLDTSEASMRELPEEYKLLAQSIFRENKHSVQAPAANVLSNTSEQQSESGLSKINNAVSSYQDASGASQLNAESDSSGNSTQEENVSDTMPFETQAHKTNNGAPFSLGSQTDGNGAQSNSSDFQHNTHTSVNNGAPLSPSIANDKVSDRLFYGAGEPGVEQTQENIMEQIFQKIRLTTHGDRSEIKLSLNPPELGSVRIHLTEENDEIEAKIFVENAEVKAAIENNAHHFRESIAASGIEINKLEVHIQSNDANKQSLVDNFDAYNQRHNQAHGHEGRGEGQNHHEEEATNTLQTENNKHTSDLTVDYLI